MKEGGLEKHGFVHSSLLHLIPGFIKGMAFFAFIPVVEGFGYPNVLALFLANISVVIPLLTVFFLMERRRTGSHSVADLIHYRERMPLWRYVIWVPAVLLASIILFSLLQPVSNYLELQMTWFPDAFKLDFGMDGRYPKDVLIVTLAIGIVGLFVGPVWEEIYFRGYLLPRMPDLHGCAPIVHSGLFAIYHIWSPWHIVTRLIAVLPLIYAVRKNRSVLTGISAHILLNALDYVVLAIFISGSA